MWDVTINKDLFEDIDAGETAGRDEVGGNSKVKGEYMHSRFPARVLSKDLPEFSLE